MENYETGEIVDTLINNYKNDTHIEEVEFNSQPDVDVIHEITRKLLRIVFPGYFREKNFKFYNLSSYINSLIDIELLVRNKRCPFTIFLVS